MPVLQGGDHDGSIAWRAVALALATGAFLACGHQGPSARDAARLLADEGRYDAAVAAFDELLSRTPDDAIAVSGWCRATRRLGRAQEIATRFDAVEGAGGSLARGLAASYAGDADAAEAELTRALESYHALGDDLAEATTHSALGIVALVTRNQPEKALEHFDRAEALARAARDEIVVAEVVTNRANALRATDQAERAEAAFVEAERLAARLRFEGLRATIQAGIGNLRRDAGDWTGAIDSFSRARSGFETRSDSIGQAQSGVNLALALQRTGRHREAIAAALAAGDVARSVGDRRLEARAFEAQGNSLVEMGENERARAAFTAGAERLAGVEAPAVQAAIWTGLGNVELAVHDFDAACAWYQKSLELNQASGDIEGEAIDRVNLGNAHLEAGRWAAAAVEFDRAAALYETDIDDPGREARALVGLSRLDEALGNSAPARGRLNRALVLTRRAKDPAAEALVLSLLGRHDLDEGAPAIALVRFEQAQGLLSGELPPPEQARQDLNASDALRALGRLDEARSRAEEALRALGADGDLDLRGIAELSLARIESDLHDDRRALGRLDEAARMLEDAADDETRIEVGILAAKIHERLGDRDAARRALEPAVRLEQDLLDRAGGSDLETGLQALSASASHALALLLARIGDSTGAFEALEGGRARALRRQAAASELRGAEDEQSREWRRARAEISRDTTRLRQSSLPREERTELLERVDRAEREAALALRAREANSRLPGPGLAVTAASVQSRLRPGEALAAFALGEAESFVWLVRRDRIELLTLAGASELRAGVEALASGLLRDDNPAVERAADQLGRLVAAELARRWSDLTLLYVVPDDALWRMPFHALRVEHGGGMRYVSEILETVVLPAAAFLSDLRSHARHRRTPLSGAVIAFGDPRLSPGTDSPKWQIVTASGSSTRGMIEDSRRLEPLPASAEEARAIQRLYRPGRSRALVGAEATEAAFKSWAGQGAAVLHVASHALWDERVVQRSALVLAADGKGEDDGLLTVGEIAGLKLGGSLVILSACSTVGDRVVSGEGMQGLARAFLGAGAAGVIATQWPIDDRAAAAVMISFHQGLAAGRPAAQALNDARIALLRAREPALASPSAWAAFVLIGDPGITVGTH